MQRVHVNSDIVFAKSQADHGPNHIKTGTELKVGDTVVVHLVYDGQPVDSTATVSHIDVAKETFKFTEWGDDAYPWGDYGLAPYKAGTRFENVSVEGMFHQKHWLERVAVN